MILSNIGDWLKFSCLISGLAIQPILTIPLGQAGGVGSVSGGGVSNVESSSPLVNHLASLHHLHQPNQQPQHQQQTHQHQQHHQPHSGKNLHRVYFSRN